MKKIISIVMSVIGGLFIVLVIAIMISAMRSINNNEPAFVFNYALGVVATPSMIGDEEDSLNVNDMYIMKRAVINDVTIGDVVIYQGTYDGIDIPIIHRIVGETSEGYITQGDNNDYTDQEDIGNGNTQDYVNSDNIIGKYVFKITFLKFLSTLAIGNRGYIFFALVIVISILLITEIIDLMKSYQNEKMKLLKETNEEELEELRAQMKKDILKEIENEQKE